ncbi:MAG: hypothetical protein ACOX8U_08320 [Bradymonadia bacterium]
MNSLKMSLKMKLGSVPMALRGVARDRLRFDTDVETERRRRLAELCAMDGMHSTQRIL